MKEETKNTNPKFYEEWSVEQLVKELCRLNQLLLEEFDEMFAGKSGEGRGERKMF